MARINIEDSLYADPRFMRFCVKLGDEARALGFIIIAFRLAQKHWCPEKKLIPMTEWEQSGLPKELIECGLVETRDGSLYVRGSESQFAWYFQRSDAGKKGGRPKAAVKRGKAGAYREKADDKREKAGQSGTNPLTPSHLPSLTPSPSLFPAQTHSELKAGLVVPDESPDGVPEVRSPVGFFIARYVHAYQRRYGEKARPDLRGKVQGQIKRFMYETPTERAINLIEVYLQMDDPWFKTKAHDFGTFLENQSKIGLALDTGSQTPGVNWDELEKQLEGA